MLYAVKRQFYINSCTIESIHTHRQKAEDACARIAEKEKGDSHEKFVVEAVALQERPIRTARVPDPSPGEAIWIVRDISGEEYRDVFATNSEGSASLWKMEKQGKRPPKDELMIFEMKVEE